MLKNAANANANQRYCDNNGELIYQFNTAGMNSCTLTMSILQNYIIHISKDGENWELIEDASEGGTIPYLTNGNNAKDLPVDLLAYADAETGAVYVKIGNSYPGQGHGGSIKSFTLDYTRAAQ